MAESSPATDPSPSAEPSSPPVAIEIPALEHPFDVASLLAAMRDSRRPGGVPDELETDAIAGAVADALWAFAGQPWTTAVVGGSCGPQSCTLEVAGATPGAQTDDVWVFTVTPATGDVRLLDAELGSVPPELLPTLDEAARALDGSGSLEGMLLASVSWLPPPQAGSFVMSVSIT